MGDTAEGMNHELQNELAPDMTIDGLDAAETEQELDTALHEAIHDLDDEVKSTLVSLQDEIEDGYVEYITRLMAERPILFDGEDNNYLAAYILWDHGDMAGAIGHLYHSAYEDRESSVAYTADIIRGWIAAYDTAGQYDDRTDEKILSAMPIEQPYVGRYGYEDDAANIPSGLDIVLEQLKDIAVSEMDDIPLLTPTLDTGITTIVGPSVDRSRSHQMVADVPTSEIDAYVTDIIQSWQDAKRDIAALTHETQREMGVETPDASDDSHAVSPNAVDGVALMSVDEQSHALDEHVVPHDQHLETQERGELSDDPLYYLSENIVVEKLMGELGRGNTTLSLDLRAGIDHYADILGPISLKTTGGERSWSVLMAPNMVGAIRDAQMQPEDVSVVPHTLRDDMSTSGLGMVQRGISSYQMDHTVDSSSQTVETEEDGMQVVTLLSPAQQNYSWMTYGHIARMMYGYRFGTLPTVTQEEFAPLMGWSLPGYDILYDSVYERDVAALDAYTSEDMVDSQLVVELRQSSLFYENTPAHRFVIQKKQNDTYEIYPMIGKFLRGHHPDQVVHADELTQTLYSYLSPISETADSVVDDGTLAGSMLSLVRGLISLDESPERYDAMMERIDDAFATAPSDFHVAQRSGEELATTFFGDEIDLLPYGVDSEYEISEDGDLLRLSFGPDTLLESSEIIGDGENNGMGIYAMMLATTMNNMNMIEIREVTEETYSLYGQEMRKEQVQEFINTVAIPRSFYAYAVRYAAYAVAHLLHDQNDLTISDDRDDIEQYYIGFVIDALHGDTMLLDTPLA